MRLIKKALTLLCIGIFFMCTTACVDKSWAIKSETETLSTGIYVFYLMQSYQEATQKLVSEGKSASDMSNETIDGQSAANWIVENTLKMCKELIAIEKEFSDLGLSFSEEENSKNQETTDKFWESVGNLYEKNYGINKDAVHRASTIFAAKKEKIFHAIYGKEGTQPVSDDEIKDFYKSNYETIYFYSKTPFEDTSEENKTNNESAETNNSENESSDKTTEQNESTESSKEENKKVDTEESIQKEFGEYVEAINSSTQTIDQLRENIKKNDSLSEDTDPLVEQVTNPNSEAIVSEVSEAIKALSPGKASYIKFNDIYLLLIKSSAATKEPDLENETERNNILLDMKNKDFENKIKETINSINFKINYNALNQYNPLMFTHLISA